mgnify:CR=1 FL=1
MNLLKNITIASIAGALLFSLSCDDRLPSESVATVETGSLELSYVCLLYTSDAADES